VVYEALVMIQSIVNTTASRQRNVMFRCLTVWLATDPPSMTPLVRYPAGPYRHERIVAGEASAAILIAPQRSVR
jgi:hypothetical protein